MSRRLTAVLLASTTASLGLAACGGSDNGAKPVVDVSSIPAGTTYVKLDAGFVKALGQLKLTPAPVGAATIKGGSARFPITSGNVKYFKPGTKSPYVQGDLMHMGSGLSLSSGSTTVALTDFDIDPGKSVLTGTVRVNGKVAKKDVKLFFLNGSTLQPLRAISDGAVLEGTTVELEQGAADLLNKTFGTKALAGGFKIGVAKIVVRTKVS